MRMWKVNPRKMCNQHILGEHVEMHMFIGSIRAGKRIDGFIEKGLVEVHNIIKRHNEIAREMTRRGFNHKSAPMKVNLWREGRVNIKKSTLELNKRCKECRELK